MESPIVAFGVSGPEVVVLRCAKRPAAADVCKFSELSGEGLGFFVPRTGMSEGAGEVRCAGCPQVTV